MVFLIYKCKCSLVWLMSVADAPHPWLSARAEDSCQCHGSTVSAASQLVRWWSRRQGLYAASFCDFVSVAVRCLTERCFKMPLILIFFTDSALLYNIVCTFAMCWWMLVYTSSLLLWLEWLVALLEPCELSVMLVKMWQIWFFLSQVECCCFPAEVRLWFIRKVVKVQYSWNTVYF